MYKYLKKQPQPAREGAEKTVRQANRSTGTESVIPSDRNFNYKRGQSPLFIKRIKNRYTYIRGFAAAISAFIALFYRVCLSAYRMTAASVDVYRIAELKTGYRLIKEAG
jgi:hypothetical protein